MTLTDAGLLLVAVLVLAVPCLIVAGAYAEWCENRPDRPAEPEEWVDLGDDPLAHIDHVPVEHYRRTR